MFQKQCKKREIYIYTMEGSKSILIFWESSDAKWKGGRAGRGKLERGTAMCSIIALSRSLLLPHVLPNVILLCKVFLHIETPVDF